MIRLFIDFDGVILDTIPKLYSLVELEGIDIRNEEKTRNFFECVDFSQIVNDENILNDSINCIKRLIDSKLFEISILTHVNSLNEGCVKIEYIRNYFKDITIIIVPKSVSKTKMVHSKNAILIDDYSGNLIEWEKAEGIAVRFNKTLESRGFLVINSLDDIIPIAQKLKEEICE